MNTPSTNVVLVNSWDDDFFNLNETSPWSREKKDDKVKTELDLLVLSSALYRLRTTTPKNEGTYHIHGMSLEDPTLSNKVLPEDYILADNIKEHFGQKLMMLKLKSVPLTKFREDLNSFLHGNWHTDPAGVFIYPKNFVGMVYKLPYLYEYDMSIRDVFESEYQEIVGPQTVKGEKKLELIKVITPVRKNFNNVEYWFSDDKNNRVMVSVEKNNPLMSVFDSLVKNPINIKGKFEMRRKDSTQFYNTPTWEVVL